MTRTDDETLSRWLDGELPPDEAASVEAAVDDDPAVAARVEALLALHADLDHLARTPPIAATAPRRVPVAAWALAAAALLVAAIGWLRPTPVPVVTVGVGEHHVDGLAVLAVDDLRIHVDGVADVRVEPRAAAAREGRAEEVDMPTREGWIGLAAGAAITVAVQQGTAWIVGDATPGTTVNPGETTTMLTPGQAAPTPPSRAPEATRPASVDAGTAEMLDALADLEDDPEDVASLRAALAAAELRAQVAEAQLEAATGAPSDWPHDVHPDWTAEATAARLEDVARDFEGVSVEELDCGEFPCIAVLSIDPSDDPEADNALIRRIEEAGAPDDSAGALVLASQAQGEDGEPLGLTMVTAWLPEGGSPNDPVHVRTKTRAEALGQAWEPRGPDGP